MTLYQLSNDFASANTPRVRRPERLSVVTGRILAKLRFQRQVEHLHKLGPRAVGELLLEVSDPIDLEIRLGKYARLDPDFLKAFGGDRFPAPPIREVSG